MLNYLMHDVLILLARTDSTVSLLRMFLALPAAKKKEKKSREYSISGNERVRLSPPASSSYILTGIKRRERTLSRRCETCNVEFARKSAQRDARDVAIKIYLLDTIRHFENWGTSGWSDSERGLSRHFIKLIMQVASNISWWVISTCEIKGHGKRNTGRPIHLVYLYLSMSANSRVFKRIFL